jgi:hypothetical protein
MSILFRDSTRMLPWVIGFPKITVFRSPNEPPAKRIALEKIIPS